jgi:hypothetical protein
MALRRAPFDKKNVAPCIADVPFNAKLCPYDDYKNMSTLNTYCGILSTCHNYKKNIIVD